MNSELAEESEKEPLLQTKTKPALNEEQYQSSSYCIVLVKEPLLEPVPKTELELATRKLSQNLA